MQFVRMCVASGSRQTAARLLSSVRVHQRADVIIVLCTTRQEAHVSYRSKENTKSRDTWHSISGGFETCRTQNQSCHLFTGILSF